MNENRRSGNDRRLMALEHQGDRRRYVERRQLVRNSEITIGRLRTIPIFYDLTMEQYNKIVLICSKKSFYHNEEIYRTGDDPTSLFILTEGKLKAHFQDKRELSLLTPKDAIGIMEFFTLLKFRHTITADSDCTMITISNNELSTLFESDKNLWVKILSNLIRELYNKINNDNEIIRNLYNTNTLEIFNLLSES